ncbi:MAG: hypothetical protein PW735_09085 [Acidobacteriaceae bacterium]|nr:hypothetical protein [Acidobacteriaceae bacterium]
MSFESVMATIGKDVKGFFSKLAVDVKLAKQVWLLISSAETRSVLLTLGADAIKLVKDATVALESKGLSLALDEAVVSDIQKLIADARAGDAVLVADLKALGISL